MVNRVEHEKSLITSGPGLICVPFFTAGDGVANSEHWED